jgi:hypothetical protein
MHSNISRRDRERAPQADRPATLEKQILQDDVARRNLSAPLGGGWWWRGSGSGTRSRLTSTAVLRWSLGRLDWHNIALGKPPIAPS